MDMETIRRINREALRAAQEAERGAPERMMGQQQQMTMYLVAAIVGVAVYFILRSWKPAFVLKKDAKGDAMFDNLKGILAAIAAALITLLIYYYATMQKK